VVRLLTTLRGTNRFLLVCRLAAAVATISSILLMTGTGMAHAMSSMNTIPLTQVSELSCPTTAHCVAVGEADPHVLGIARSLNGGQSWKAVSPQNGLSELSDVTCPSSLRCIAVGYAGEPLEQTGGALVLFSTDSGGHWTRSLLTGGMTSLNSVACFSMQRCAAVGGSSGPILTMDGGASWSLAVVRAPRPVLSSVSCATAEVCVSVGKIGPGASPVSLVTSDAGLIWTQHRLPSGFGNPGMVSCTKERSCLAVSPGLANLLPVLATSSNAGLSWHRVRSFPREIGLLFSIECVDHDRCIGFGLDRTTPARVVGLFSGDHGQNWHTVTLPAGIQSVRGVSCNSRTCDAIGLTSRGFVAIRSANQGLSWGYS